MTEIPCQGLLFDLDGTLIDSLPAVERAWTKWANRVGLRPADVLPRIHGRRSLDSVRALAPDRDPVVEDAWLRREETNDTNGVRVLGGSLKLLEAVPAERWLIVTSGTRDVATARIAASGIPVRPNNVYGDDVQNGKPDPEPFALGAARLGVPASDCVAFEDTVGGVQSAAGAGCIVVGISHTDRAVSDLKAAGVSHVVRSLETIRASKTSAGVLLTIEEA